MFLQLCNHHTILEYFHHPRRETCSPTSTMAASGGQCRFLVGTLLQRPAGTMRTRGCLGPTHHPSLRPKLLPDWLAALLAAWVRTGPPGCPPSPALSSCWCHRWGSPVLRPSSAPSRPVSSHSPPPRTPLAPVAVHGPTCCSPVPGTRWVFSKHHLGARARLPVGLCHVPAVCDKHLDLHAHRPTRGTVQGPWGPQPRAEWRCPEQPRCVAQSCP